MLIIHHIYICKTVLIMALIIITDAAFNIGKSWSKMVTCSLLSLIKVYKAFVTLSFLWNNFLFCCISNTKMSFFIHLMAITVKFCCCIYWFESQIVELRSWWTVLNALFHFELWLLRLALFKVNKLYNKIWTCLEELIKELWQENFYFYLKAFF